MLTGESSPVSKKTGGKVIGGSINGEGALTIEVKGTGKDSFLSQVIDLVKQAQESKSKTQDLADRAALWLTLIALGSGALTLVVWLVVMEHEFAFAIERAVTVMVITCPHALGLAIPLVVAVSTALAASNGLLIRNRGRSKRARKLQAVIFDKTGTLTEGRFGVTDTLVLSRGRSTRQTLRTYAASVEANSEHPIARAIAASSETKLPVEDFKASRARAPKAGSRAKTSRWSAPATCAIRTSTSTDKRIAAAAGPGQDGRLRPRRRGAEGSDRPGRHHPPRGEARPSLRSRRWASAA